VTALIGASTDASLSDLVLELDVCLNTNVFGALNATKLYAWIGWYINIAGFNGSVSLELIVWTIMTERNGSFRKKCRKKKCHEIRRTYVYSMRNKDQ